MLYKDIFKANFNDCNNNNQKKKITKKKVNELDIFINQ